MQNALCTPMPVMLNKSKRDIQKKDVILNLFQDLKQGVETQKLLRIMRITMVLLTVACLSAGAKGFSQRINLSVKDAPLGNVIEQIKKQTGYSFFYNVDWLAKAKNVTANLKDVAIEKALDIVFKDQPLSYTIINNTIVLKLKDKNIDLTNENVSLTNLPPPIDIHGRIVDENGKPVVVTVMVKGTNKGVTTNDNGEFEIKNVDDNAILVISGVSIQTFELKVNGKTDLGTLNAKIKTTTGEEIKVEINTGYQKISKERFVGSFSQLDSANFHRQTGKGIIERLDGTVTGFSLSKKGGDAPIQIRGISSFSVLKPLIVVDNFPMDAPFDINNINQSDVENITVLKDAAATSIWGARAGNGVIVVTTKSGKYNQRFNISASSNVTVTNKPDLFYIPRISNSDFIDVEQFLFSKGYYDADIASVTHPVLSPVVDILAQQRAGTLTATEAKAKIDAYRNVDIRNDLNKYVYEKAIRQQNYLSLSGGNNLLGYSLSGGYDIVKPGIQGSKNDTRYTLNSSTSIKPIRNLEVSIGLRYSQNVKKSAGIPSGTDRFPYTPLADANGQPLAIPFKYREAYIDNVGGGNLLDWGYRPLDEIKLSDNQNNNRFFNLNLGITFHFTSWLNANVQYGNMNQTGLTRNLYSQQTFFVRDLINTYTNLSQTNNDLRYPVPMGGILDVATSEIKANNYRGTLNFNPDWGANHSLTAMIGAERSESNGKTFSTRFYGYNDLVGTYKLTIDHINPYPTPYTGGSGASSIIQDVSSYSDANINRTVSFFSNASYSFLKKYTLYASARRDGANIFGVNTNNRWKPLWSAGGSWDISKEDFYKLAWMPSLRLRASYGYSGNSNNFGTGKFTLFYDRLTAPFTNLTTAQVAMAPNPDLRWEQVGIINLGLDFNLLNNKLSGSIDLFHKKSTDVISYVPFDPTSGVNDFYINIASLKGKGFELKLDYKDKIGALSVNSNFGLSYAKSIVTKAYYNNYRVSDYVQYGTIQPTVGRIAFGLSSYRWGGLDPSTGDPMGIVDGHVTKDYQTIFNDSVDHQRFHGSSVPLLTSFFNNTISWKNFSLSAIITGKFNFYYRKPALSIDYSGQLGGQNYTEDYYKRWQRPGDESYTNVPSMIYPVPIAVSSRNAFYQNSELFVARGDNIRLQDIRLSYGWENKKYKNLPIKTLGLFIYPGNLNLILWKADNSNYDPEFTGGTSPTGGPTPKSWSAGINITFR